MKKFLCAVLSLVMVMSLAACGKKDEAPEEGNGTLKVGITYYEPMNYMDENGELTGFETEFTKAVCEKLGLTPEFVEINWDSKVMELDSQNIDCIWNGMTKTAQL